MNTVCLCGSTKFLDDFNTANIELTKRGLTVITISMSLPRQPNGEQEEGLKDLLDLVHLNKILRADCILVVGPGYIGRSTAREILWARMQERPMIAQYTYVGSWDIIAFRCRERLVDKHLVIEAKRVLGITL